MKKRSESINRLIYTVILLGIFILIGIGTFVVNAYGGTQPNVMGHSAGEIEGVCMTDGTGCPSSSSGIASGFCVFSRTQTGCPTGWTRDSGFDGRTIRGALSPGGTGGSESHTHTGVSHTHTYSGTTSTYTSWKALQTSTFQNRDYGSKSHSHTYSGTTSASGAGNTGSASSWSPYRNVIVCCKD